MASLIRISKLILLLLVVLSPYARADWHCRTDSAVAVSTNKGNQWNVHLVTDGGNGAIIVWQDRRDGLYDKIYVQKINATGQAEWAEGGIPLATSGGFQYYPQMIPDGQGGAVIVWQDNRNGVDYDIFAQRISSNGTTSWYPNGTAVCSAAGHQYNPQVVADGQGGFLITWQDRRSGQFDIYAQRLTATGDAEWVADGQVVCDAPSDQLQPKLVADGVGGAMVAWMDYRANNGYTDIFCQLLNPDGSKNFSSEGVPVCVASNTQWDVDMKSDGVGNCIVVWQDRRTGSYDNVYAQKIDMKGNAVWATDGIPLAPLPGMQYYPQVVSDEAGGAIVVWQDNRNGTDYNIYGQHILSDGQLMWAPIGLPICVAGEAQYNPQVISQGSDFIVTWQDRRSGDFDIYAQRVSESGTVAWEPDGELVAQLPYDQFMPQIVSDNLNGGILAWADYQHGDGTTDVYAQRIGANGKLAGGCFRTFTQQMFASKGVRIRNHNSPAVLNAPNEGNVRDSVFGRGGFATGIVIGVERKDSNRSYGWEYFTRSFYVRHALPQSGTARPFDYIFDRKFVNRLRNPSTFRYDNRLAGELLALKLNIAASDVGLTDRGFGDLIFRDLSLKPIKALTGRSLREVAAIMDSLVTYWRQVQGVDYGSLANILSTINNAFSGPMDTTSTTPLRIPPTRALFSIPSLAPGVKPPVALPSFTAQQVDEEVPEGFALFQNYPNPFNPFTTIEFNITEPSLVTLKVYNTLGQEISSLLENTMLDEGRQLVDFDGLKLSSGVYFYRLDVNPVSASGKVMTKVKKMILLK